MDGLSSINITANSVLVKHLASKEAAVVTFAYGDKLKDFNKAGATEVSSWVSWGNDNLTPDELLQVVLNNAIMSGILSTQEDIICGRRVVLKKRTVIDGKEIFEDVEYEDAQRFLDRSEYHENMRKWCRDLKWSGNFFVEYLPSRLGHIISVSHIDFTRVRSGKINADTKRAAGFFVSDDWALSPKYDADSPRDGNVLAIPAFIPNSGRKQKVKSIQHLKEYVPGFPYYPPPSWYGAKEYILLANRIPRFHRNALDNGYNLRYHIEIPESYFDDCNNNIEEITKKRKTFTTMVGEFLSGVDNAGKSLFTEIYRNGTTEDRFIVKPIPVNLNDEAYKGLFDMVNSAIVSCMGIDPSLAGIQMSGTLISSGADKRVALDIYETQKCSGVRALLLRPFNEVKKINGWPDWLTLTIESLNVSALNANHSGSSTNHVPTA